MKSAVSLLYCWVFCKVAQMLSGMAALNGGLGATGLTNGTAGTMDALTQAYSGIQQYAAAALPTLYSQSLLQQQSAAGSQKEGGCPTRPAGSVRPRSRVPREVVISRCPEKSGLFISPAHGLRHLTGLNTLLQCSSCLGPATLCVPYRSYLVAAAKLLPGAPSPASEGPSPFSPPPRLLVRRRPSRQRSVPGAHRLLQGPRPPVTGKLALQLAMVSRLMTKSTLRIDPVFV